MQDELGGHDGAVHARHHDLVAIARPGGHAEILYQDVRVPYENVVGNPGDGFLLVTPDADGLRSVVTAVLAAGPGYGRPSRPVPSMVVDPTVPQRRTLDNLLFVVMWAHSRCCVVLNRKTTDGTAPAALTEGVLVLLLADLPRALAAAGDDPAVVLRRLHEVAAATHAWLDESGDRDGWLDGSDVRERGRLPLVEAVRQVLATGLDVLGLPAPTRC